MTRIAALLAAGGGTRFHGPQHKLLAHLHGTPVWEWALRHVMDAGFDHVVVVTGAVDLTLPDDVVRRHNPGWADGQAGSLQLAVDAARELGATHVTIGLADQPFVTAEAWRTVGWAPDECRIVVATYDGIVGPHPIRLSDAAWPLLPTTGDEGGRSLLHVHPTWVCRLPCLGSGADIDTTEDLDRWKSC
jgi:molybdenum cofactor cytidylyltransferase